MSSFRIKAAVITVVLAAPVQAEGLCAALGSFVATTATWTAGDPQPVLDITALPEAQRSCGMSLAMSGVRSGHCAWAFAFRAEGATVAFEEVLAAVGQCGTAQVPKKAQAGVNHPDSFDQRMFAVGAGVVSVSLKDKGALGETYVFVRAQGQP